MTIDPEMLMAFADHELDPLSANRVEKLIAADPALAAQVAAHRSLRTRLEGHFAPVIAAPVPDRLTDLLDLQVVPLEAVSKAPVFLPARSLVAMAAALVIGLMLGQVIDLGTPALVGSRQGELVAQGDLARSLNTQLASAQPASAATRIGLTFWDRSGQICRTFEGTSLSGIACRVSGNWQLKRVIAGEKKAGEGYRQASSGELMDAAQAMMADDPLDAAGERMVRNSGWQ
ncbi:anti-sigma factor family protein [Sphingobium boeckii]|uniref:Anti-sigma factor n=1 Tax=Sphingobium boeckii TaxID=1082345 RepID=A0A7W9AG13_9SPHN|nr:anti-sigma factor [Sphingobium boeckii]MBB5684944.1 hypothetical protein [Sphingobium boeckii]